MKNRLSEDQLNIFPIILVFYEIAIYLANDAYLPAMPEIAHQFRVSTHLVQFTLPAFFLGNALMQPIIGPVSEYFGRRRILLCGGVVFVLATLVATVCNDIYLLIAIRFIQGSTISSMGIAGYATIHAMYSQVRAIKTLAWMSSVVVLAPGLGPLFGALILLAGSWRLVFLIIAIWAIIGWIFLYRMMPETCDKPTPLSPVDNLKKYYRAISNWTYTRPLIVLAALFAAEIVWITAGPFIVINYFKLSAVVFGVSQGLVFGSFILGNYYTNRSIEKVSLRKITKLSVIIPMLGGVLCFVLNLILKPHLVWVLIPMMLVSLGAGIGFPVFNRLAVEGSDENMGIKIGLLSCLMSVGALVGSAFISIFSVNNAFGFSVVLLVISLVLAPFYFFMNAYTSGPIVDNHRG